LTKIIDDSCTKLFMRILRENSLSLATVPRERTSFSKCEVNASCVCWYEIWDSPVRARRRTLRLFGRRCKPGPTSWPAFLEPWRQMLQVHFNPWLRLSQEECWLPTRHELDWVDRPTRRPLGDRCDCCGCGRLLHIDVHRIRHVGFL